MSYFGTTISLINQLFQKSFFPFFSLGHVIAETCKFILLFIDFYIPYVFLFFMLFGGSPEDAGKTKLKEDHEMKTLADVVSYFYPYCMVCYTYLTDIWQVVRSVET